MKKKLTLCYLIASVITIFVIIIDISVRSPLLSPYLLFENQNSNSPSIPKVITGYSDLQEDHLLLINNKESDTSYKKPSMKFELGQKSFSFHQIEHKGEVPIKEGMVEVITRKGIIPVFEQNLPVKESANIFVNKYIVTLGNESFSLQLQSEYPLFWLFASFVFSILFPAFLFFIYRLWVLKGKEMDNIFIIFLPYALSVLFPCLNYFYFMNFILLRTDSYIISIILSIMMPTILSILLTLKAGDYYSDAIVKMKKEEGSYDESVTEESTFFSLKEKRKIIILVSLALLYVSMYILIPFSIQSVIINNLLLFILWYLSVTALIFVCFSFLHRYSGDYKELDKRHELQRTIEELSNEIGQKISILVKQKSRDEMNAWVYSLNIVPSTSIMIHMTEGLIDRFNEKEIKTIIYHELGHVKLRHGKLILSLTFAVAVAVSALMFYTRQVMLVNGWWQYLMVFPIGVLALVFISEWLPKKISKIFEHQADAYVINQTNEKELYIHTLIKLTNYNDDDTYSNKRSEWHDTHPSLQKRIDYIERNY